MASFASSATMCGAHKHTWNKKEREKRRDRTMVITMAKLRMAHASTHGARKPPGPKFQDKSQLPSFSLEGIGRNTPGTRGGPGGRDRTLAVKRRKNAQKSAFFVKKKNYLKKYFFLHISSSYAKILGETNFHAQEIPRSG